MAGRLRRTGWLLLGCAILLALTVIFAGAAIVAAAAGVLCLVGAAAAGWLGRRAPGATGVPAQVETS